MAVQRVGQIVQVRGRQYKIIDLYHAGVNGSKWWGKFRFYLQSLDRDEIVSAFGKQVSGNSKLHPVSESDLQRLKGK